MNYEKYTQGSITLEEADELLVLRALRQDETSYYALCAAYSLANYHKSRTVKRFWPVRKRWLKFVSIPRQRLMMQILKEGRKRIYFESITPSN